MTATFALSQSEDKETYAIYDAVIRKMFAGDKVTFNLGGTKVTQLVIRDHTITYFAFEKRENWDILVKPRFKQLSDDAIADYSLKAKSSVNLERKFGTHLSYKLISKKELDTRFGEQNPDYMDKKWKEFHESYPGSMGYISLSNIGLNSSKDKAVVYFEQWCGPLCGTGHVISLAKQDGHWEVVERARIWIS